MEIRDLFVAIVAFILGGMMLHAAILDQGWCFRMSIARKIDEAMGREQARTFIGSIGTLLLLISLYLVLAPLVASSLFQSTQVNVPVSELENSTLNLAEVD
jgi:Na+-translocating ferredoxin:NAD+ oxidoreductase RnfA subunit